jgi:hypothetical protein
METFIWNTEYAHKDNEQTMQEWLHEYCELDIILTDRTYAEAMDKQGNLWAIYASGNQDSFNHKIEFEAL